MSTKVLALVRHNVQTNTLNTVTIMKSNLSWASLNCHTMYWDTAALNSALRWTVDIFHHILHDKVISTYNFCFVQPRWWLGWMWRDCFINICYAHLLRIFEHINMKFVHHKLALNKNVLFTNKPLGAPNKTLQENLPWTSTSTPICFMLQEPS